MTRAKTQIWQRLAHPVGIVTRYVAFIAAIGALWFHFWWVVVPCVLYMAASAFVFPKPKSSDNPLTRAAVGSYMDRKMRRDRSDSMIPLTTVIPVLALLSLIVVVYYNAIIQTVLLTLIVVVSHVISLRKMVKLYHEFGEGALDQGAVRDTDAALASGYLKGRDGRPVDTPIPTKDVVKKKVAKRKVANKNVQKPQSQQRSRMEQILETAQKRAKPGNRNPKG